MDKFTQKWVQHLRNTSRQGTSPRNARCPLCEAGFEPNLEAFKTHVRSNALQHPTLTGDSDLEEAFQNILLQRLDANKAVGSTANPSMDKQSGCLTAGKRPISANAEGDTAGDESDRLKLESDQLASSPRESKRLCSPPASITQQHGSSSPPPTPSRSKAQQKASMDEFDRGIRLRNQSARRLWVPEDDRRAVLSQGRSKTTQTGHSHGQSASSSTPHRVSSQHDKQPHSGPQCLIPNEPAWSPMRLQMPHQPITRPVTREQLLSEVKGIYAGLVLLEAKCIEYDTNLRTVTLNDNQYHALISLHQSLLHEHHDFYLASQHPAACDALQRIGAKYAMPARMWRHGIHSFLELLRCKLPESQEYLLAFIYIAYSMMALLTETVPIFQSTWIECLGDLGRYRMAIEDTNNVGNRELWTNVAHYWYTMASDSMPMTGRLYHHLAILARTNILRQLFLYAKSLCAQIPFAGARESIMTLFKPIMYPSSSLQQHSDVVYIAFVRVHAILFSGQQMDQLEESMDQFLDSLDSRIGTARRSWIESGYNIGISLSCLLLGYGDKSSVLMQAFSIPSGDDDDENEEPPSNDADAIALSESKFESAISFAEMTYDIVIRRWNDKNTLPFLHTILAFYFAMSKRPEAMELVEDGFPWKLASLRLNYLLKTCEFPPRIDTTDFPGPEKKEPPHPLPEDYAMYGLIYTLTYFPQGWFNNDKIEADEKYFERPSTMLKRCERILWIARMLARQEKWLLWDEGTEMFSVTEKYDVEI
ncbi:hypothetical protein E4U54_003742 [Claviceps lovelessii]|nr:hypothetical protein E4U54_003742 [Claviceps lovelessii]